MQIKKAIFLGFIACLFAITANAADKKYTNAEIYSKMCSKCHGLNGEGNPAKKGPALNDQTAHELEMSLIDLKSGGLNQSSGTEHEIMEHNMQKIIEKGMDYEPKSMSEYIFVAFNPEAKYYKKGDEKRSYTVSEIYAKMCSKCHGLAAEGNPAKKGPALNDKTSHELEMSLIDLKSGGLNQSSGTEHEIMEHNQNKIEEKGMDYSPKEMADFIENNFYKK
ncbi:cytochrome c4 [Halarcobacter anaerophilus]|jgi:cytochrome c553|uniref:Cytochrome c domain-containing protein n=1 Tax=Halarcobacter anaerophilus TaxID=877500 RepID=A0A4Q0Y277_9BACT|nr:c-type cytochrome [Halarcobacter anaerophilus]QDF27800.1 hypothetical protein AANAER_0291 [Halarcobacter anaerophilus]RXJ64142.1 hypothetical protein CRV06_04155 [Halarcobacter anaerophilus]